jgi:hypothetical protein
MSVRQKQEESKKKMEKEHDELTQRKIENIRPYRFQKGQSGNPKGRKPLSIKSVCDALKKDGYKIPKQEDIAKSYLYVLALDELKLKEIINDKEQPMLVRVVARNVLGGKGFDIAERMIDRALGKVGQKLDITSGGEKLKQEPLTIEVIDSRSQVDERTDE